jgi:hypothetical protein
LGSDLAAVGAGHGPDDRQPEAEAALAVGLGRTAPVERLEERLNLVPGDLGSGIGDS